MSAKTTHRKDEKCFLFTDCLYSEGQFYIHWTNIKLTGGGKGYLQLHLISGMINELIKAPQNNILLKALIISHSKC